VVAGIAGCQPGDRRRAASLSRWFDGYAAGLRHHHRVEDEIFFPALAERVPSHVECAPVLAADHEQVDDLLDDIQSTLAELADAGDRWHSLHGHVLAQAEELRALLADHLDLEDADVLPLFERHFGADEYQALDAEALKSVPLRQLRFTVPWLMATSDPAAAAAELASAPRAVRLIWRATRRRYARLAHRAFGSPTPATTAASRPSTEHIASPTHRPA
jgi:hypothetical protein